MSAKIAEVLNLDAVGRPIATPIAEALQVDGVAENTLVRVTAVRRDVYAANAEDMTWVGELGAYCERIVARAPSRFDGTFDRWRALFDAAEKQVEEANARLKSHTIERKERKQLEAIRFNAERPMELLRGGSDGKQADFYTYRYLATKAFLPGYNLPRLPLVAFVSSGRGRGSARTMIQRPASSAFRSSAPTASSTTRDANTGSGA